MPATRTSKGERTRARLVSIAFKLFEKHGFEHTTLRDIAGEAGVSLGLLYRYFESKDALVLAHYDRLSADFAGRAADLPAGSWATRFVAAVRLSLTVLAPHRESLRALVAAVVRGADHLSGPDTPFSRERAQPVFVAVVRGAVDAPADVEALGRALYLVHFLVVLFWLLDRSDGRATRRLLALIERVLPLWRMAASLPGVGPVVADLVSILGEGVFGAATPPRESRR